MCIQRGSCAHWEYCITEVVKTSILPADKQRNKQTLEEGTRERHSKNMKSPFRKQRHQFADYWPGINFPHCFIAFINDLEKRLLACETKDLFWKVSLLEGLTASNIFFIMLTEFSNVVWGLHWCSLLYPGTILYHSLPSTTTYYYHST